MKKSKTKKQKGFNCKVTIFLGEGVELSFPGTGDWLESESVFQVLLDHIKSVNKSKK